MEGDPFAKTSYQSSFNALEFFSNRAKNSSSTFPSKIKNAVSNNQLFAPNKLNRQIYTSDKASRPIHLRSKSEMFSQQSDQYLSSNEDFMKSFSPNDEDSSEDLIRDEYQVKKLNAWDKDHIDIKSELAEQGGFQKKYNKANSIDQAYDEWLKGVSDTLSKLGLQTVEAPGFHRKHNVG